MAHREQARLFDGRILHTFEWSEDGVWQDEWWGPGGRLIVVPIDPSAPVRHFDDNSDQIAMLETHYLPDGSCRQYVGVEGADYMALPDVMGEFWPQYIQGGS